MKRTLIALLVLVPAAYALYLFNEWEGYTPLAVVVDCTFFLSMIYIISMANVKDIQERMNKT